jgi:hypothetical protein
MSMKEANPTMSDENPLKRVGHEHAFTIQTENNPYTQQSITLRICYTCGLTHTLQKDTFANQFYWTFVDEEQPRNREGSAIKGLKT